MRHAYSALHIVQHAAHIAMYTLYVHVHVYVEYLYTEVLEKEVIDLRKRWKKLFPLQRGQL